MRGRRKLALVVTDVADFDIGDQFRFIAADSPEAALRFLDAVEKTARQLCEFPRSGRRVDRSRLGELRTRQVQGFSNHLLVYVVEAEELVVARVIHAARDLNGLDIDW
jgi:toxin ParE1/3/4